MADVQESTVDQQEEKMVVLDLGSKSSKTIKRLRQGRGKLMDQVRETIDQLREENELSESSDVVVVVVKQRRKSRGFLF
ncbi:MAG: hypothetical protein K8L99_08370 [Anaerolineae bacterium]|nr:hypothetical protein [Anaerolineae bacterium]